MNRKNYVDLVKPQVLKWLESVRAKDQPWGRFKYNASMIRPYSLRASNFAIQILDIFDSLDEVPANFKEEALDYLKSCQDKDGYFKDPLVSEKDFAKGHSYKWPDIWLQSGTNEPIILLNSTTTYPAPTTVHIDLGANMDVIPWLNSLNWQDPWLEGERVSRAIAAAYSSDNLNDPQVQANVEKIFNYIESEILNPISGLPDKVEGVPSDTAMAGLFKIYNGYRTAKRMYPYTKEAIDSVLKLQTPSGDFAVRPEIPTPDGSHYIQRHKCDMCINWDAIWVLRELDKLIDGTYRHDDIVKSSIDLAECLIKDYQKEDGGFAFAAEHCVTVHAGIKISKPVPEGDILGTIMSLRCLEYVNQWK